MHNSGPALSLPESEFVCPPIGSAQVHSGMSGPQDPGAQLEWLPLRVHEPSAGLSGDNIDHDTLNGHELVKLIPRPEADF